MGNKWLDGHDVPPTFPKPPLYPAGLFALHLMIGNRDRNDIPRMGVDSPIRLCQGIRHTAVQRKENEPGQCDIGPLNVAFLDRIAPLHFLHGVRSLKSYQTNSVVPAFRILIQKVVNLVPIGILRKQTADTTVKATSNPNPHVVPPFIPIH